MTDTARDAKQTPTEESTTHPCESLLHAVQAIARNANLDIDADDLRAAMGLPFLVTAVPDEPDLGRWMRYARDAFLIPAARLFGMTIRDLHPPAAACGLRDRAEFRQHFDASYRPLIHRALENNQPVLAWQGWPGDASMLWGVITDTSDNDIGFVGRIHSSESTYVKHEFQAPPVQLYVVEAITPRTPLPHDLIDLSFDHARIALRNELTTHFGVQTGPTALDVWVNRFQPEPPPEPQASACANVRSDELHLSAYAEDDSRRALPHLIASIINNHRAAIRFLDAHFNDMTDHQKRIAASLATACQDVVTAMEGIDIRQEGRALPGGPLSGVPMSGLGRPAWLAAIDQADRACRSMLSALSTKRS